MCQNTPLTSYDCQSRMKNGHGIISMISHQHARMQNSPTMIARAEWRMVMESSAWSQPPTCLDAPLTSYESCQSRMKNGHGIISMITVTNMPECTTHILWLPEQDEEWTWIISIITVANMPECTTHPLWLPSRMKNGHGIISMITVTNMPECTTHPLWLPEQDEEWTWNHQHDHSHQHARMHHSPPMIARAEWRMDMESSAWSQSQTCQNAPLTHYDCQSRMKNGHGIISMITVTNIPECTTYPLWLPEQDEEWSWNHQHDHSHQHAWMHNLPPMIAIGSATRTDSLIW